MATIAQVRTALASAVTDGTGLRAEPLVLDSVNAPVAEVVRRPMDPRYIFSGTKANYALTVRVYWPRTAERTAQEGLDRLCEIQGPGSMVAAVEDGANWPDDLVDYAQVVRVGAVLAVERGGVEYLVVDFDVEVVW